MQFHKFDSGSCQYKSYQGRFHKTKSLLKSAILTLVALTATPPMVAAAVTDVNTNWRQVAIGGGGFVTGIIIHPSSSSTMYMRSDTGPYRWDSTNSKWVYLTGYSPKRYYYACESIAIDPNDPNIVYVSVGDGGDFSSGAGSAVLRSDNKGTSFIDTNFKKPDGKAINIAANSETKKNGEHMVVDPNDSNTLYYASSKDGLWKSINAKSATPSWSKVTTFPAVGDGTYGCTFAAIDKNGGSSIIYVGVYGNATSNDSGVYRSTNGGADWEKLANSSTLKPRQGFLSTNGTLWISHQTGVARFTRGGSGVTSMQPWGSSDSAAAIAVSPSDSNVVMAVQKFQTYTHPIWRTTNATATTPTWTKIAGNGNSTYSYTFTQAWKRGTNHFAADTASIAIDPVDSKRVWLGDWYNAWLSTNADSTSSSWTSITNGYESMVVRGMSSPPATNNSAPLFSYHADNDGFRHTDITAYPSKTLTNMGDGIGFDFSESNPNYVAHVGGNNWGTSGGGATSTNNGVDWNNFGTGITNTTFKFGKVAVGAQLLTNGKPYLVWAPMEQAPRYSTDWGANWTNTVGLTASLSGSYGDLSQPLAADRVNGNKFYAFNSSDKGFYCSTNGGANWTKTYTFSGGGDNNYVQALPGKEGEVYVSISDNNFGSSAEGLWHSSNADSAAPTFTKVANITPYSVNPGRFNFSFGKPAPGNTNPALYVMGKLSGVQGLYRSDNATSLSGDLVNATWVRIWDYNTYKNPISRENNFTTMVADRQTYGRVYVGTTGQGLWVGDSGTANSSTTIKVETYDAPAAKFSANGGSDVHRMFSETSASGGQCAILEANATGDWVAYDVPNVQPIKYDIYVQFKKGSDRGKCQMAIAAVTSGTAGSYTNHGTEQDLFNTNLTYNRIKVAQVIFGSSGTKRFKFTNNGSNGSSSGQMLPVDYIELVPVP